MRPRIVMDKNTLPGRIITLITKAPPENITAQFRHIVKKNHEPLERWEEAIRLLSGTYYQDPKDFANEITALFGPGSGIYAKLVATKTCTLIFEQNNQRFQIPVEIHKLPIKHPQYQFTFWHNSLFNPALPGESRVLAFNPDWSNAKSEKLP